MQDLRFKNPFYVPPIVLASASHDNVTNVLRDKSDGLYSNALNAWVEVRRPVILYIRIFSNYSKRARWI